MISETDALQRLSKWFKQYGWIVYQDKKNTSNNPVFHVKGESRKKPDLIAIKSGHIIAIEVKSGESGRDLGTCSKILTYYKNYNEKKTSYYDENMDAMNIEHFVIGTYYSPEGHLKKIEPEHIDKEDSRRPYAAETLKICPIKEYETTFNTIRRGLWDPLIELRKHDDRYHKCSIGLGGLLSTCLDNNGQRPGLFVMKNNGSKGWGHRWIKP